MRPPIGRTKRIFAVAAVIAALGGIALFVLFGASSRSAPSGLPIDEVYVVDADTLFVAGNSGKDSDVRRRSQMGLLKLDGSLRRVIRAAEETDVIGVADGIVWLRDDTHGLHARSLPDLALIEGAGAAIEAHAAIPRYAHPDAFTETHLRIRGFDQTPYAVGRDGSIAPADPETRWTPRERRRADASPSVDRKLARVLMRHAKAAGLTHALLVSGRRGPGFVTLDDPPSVFLQNLELGAGGSSHGLHRMTLDGRIVWSNAAEALMDALELEGQLVLLKWVGLRGNRLHALVELSEYERVDHEDYEVHVQRMVELDAATGEVLASRAVVGG